MRELVFNVVLETADGQPAMHLRSDLEDRPLALEAGGNTVGVRIPRSAMIAACRSWTSEPISFIAVPITNALCADGTIVWTLTVDTGA